MSAFAAAVVIGGLVLVLGVALASEVDALGAVLIAVIVAVGCLGVAIARRARRGAVAPATCPRCEGLISPSAPYCKHCGARLSR
jgi:hypothetical protein